MSTSYTHSHHVHAECLSHDEHNYTKATPLYQSQRQESAGAEDTKYTDKVNVFCPLFCMNFKKFLAAFPFKVHF